MRTVFPELQSWGNTFTDVTGVDIYLIAIAALVYSVYLKVKASYEYRKWKAGLSCHNIKITQLWEGLSWQPTLFGKED